MEGNVPGLFDLESMRVLFRHFLLGLFFVIQKLNSMSFNFQKESNQVCTCFVCVETKPGGSRSVGTVLLTLTQISLFSLIFCHGSTDLKNNHSHLDLSKELQSAAAIFEVFFCAFKKQLLPEISGDDVDPKAHLELIHALAPIELDTGRQLCISATTSGPNLSSSVNADLRFDSTAMHGLSSQCQSHGLLIKLHVQSRLHLC